MARREKQLYGFDAASIRDNGRATRAVLGKSRSYAQRFQTANIGGQRSVAVELLEDMEADDIEARPAKLMTLAGGSWKDTKQRVLIRNVGAQSLGTGTRCIAWPVANLGLCVCTGSGSGVLQPFNIGLMDEHNAALLAWYAAFYAPSNVSKSGRYWASQVPASLVYDTLTAPQLLESTFALNYKRPLDALFLGSHLDKLDGYPGRVLGVNITEERAAAEAAVCWTPVLGSDNETAIDLYLKRGGIVVLVVEPPAIYTTQQLTTLTDGAIAVVDRFNTWLDHVGSSTRIVSRDSVIPKIQLNLGGVIWADIRVLPLSGVVACNPDTWLGRTAKMPRMFDYTRTIQRYEFDAYRSNWVNNPSSFYQNSGPWYGSSFYRAQFSSYGNAFFNLSPFTQSLRWCLSARTQDTFLKTHVGTDAWTVRGAFPTDTHYWSWYLNAQIVEGIGTYTRYSDRQTEIHNIQTLPCATAERLPGGGKLIVTTKNALKWVIESLFRYGKSNDLLKLTTQHKINGVSRFKDIVEENRYVSGSYNGSGVAGQVTSLSVNSSLATEQQYSTQFVKGDGILSVISGSVRTIDNPSALPVQYLAAADVKKTDWTGFGGTSIWQRLATEVAIDTEYGFSVPGSSAPLVIQLERVRTFSASDPVTLRVRAAMSDGAGSITGSGGSCDLTIRLVPGGNADKTAALTETVSLSGSWQTFEFVLSGAEKTALLSNLVSTVIEFVPTSSGLGAAISWVSLETSAPSTFDALSLHVDRRLYALVENASQSPWYYVWKGTHPIFGSAGLGTSELRVRIAYPRSSIAAWGLFSSGMFPTDDTAAIYPQITGGGEWFIGSPVSAFDVGACGIPSKYEALTLENAQAVSSFTIPAGATTSFPGFPVAFQNNRFLKPFAWNEKHENAKYASTGPGENLTMWDSYHAETSFKQWVDITNWPDIPDERVDIETGPSAPPVCFGVGGEIELPYGFNGANRLFLSNAAGNNFNVVVTQSNAAIRAAWLDGYRVTP